MSDDLEIPDDQQPPEDSSVIRNLRKEAKQAKTEKDRADAAVRELTLHKAGLGSLSEMQMKALNAAHEGDWEPESIKATATELGFLHTDTPKPDGPQIPADELASMQRMASAAGGTPPPPSNLDTEAGLMAAIGEAKDEGELKAVLRAAGRLAE